jgi:multicomponent Na+:H+ antiporter subunit E
MSTGFLVVILALIWAAVSDNFSGLNLLFGGVIGSFVVLFLRNALVGRRSLRRARRIVSLIWLFLYELMLSAFRVARMVMQPNLKQTLRPAIVAVPLTVKTDWQITLLANLITLTPGTLSIDVANDRSVLFVHALTLDDRQELIAGIVNGFEKKIAEVFE